MVAIPEYNTLIVHCESALYSYSLELAIRVSQGETASKASLDDSQERLGEEHENVLFFKAGHVTGRTLSKLLNLILTCFRIAHPQNSCVCIEEFQESHIKPVRVDQPRTGGTDSSIISTFGFGSSSYAV